MSGREPGERAQVFGVDVQSGDVRGDAPAYALVELTVPTARGTHERAEADADVERDVVSGRKLRRRIDAVEPDLVATDNVYELAADSDALVEVLRSLPPRTRLVQVTGGPQPEPLSRVASRHGVPYDTDPMAEAEAAAWLAAGNVGEVVSAFGDTTEVKVSRGRSTGGGGWSEDRHTRRIHGAVKRRAREIESELEAAGLEFDREVTEKYGGYTNAVFTVAAPPTEIPVTTGRSGDVRVEMSRERRDGIDFEPLARRRDHVVIGVDPGTTTAVAVVGIDGTVHDVTSSRTADTPALIEWVVERGRPIVVAADVEPMPSTVERFRRSFDAAGWTPEADLAVDEKVHRTRDSPVENDHERDALAAALFAYDDYAERFERIAEAVPPRADAGEVTARVVAGEEQLQAVLADVVEGEAEPDSAEDGDASEPARRRPEQRRIARLEARIDRLEEHVDTLETTIEQKDDRIAEYEEELSEARRRERREARERREVTRLERENERLERELAEERETVADLEDRLERLKALWKLDHSNFSDVADEQADLVPVKAIEQFTRDAIDAAEEAFGLAEDDVILLRDASGAGRSTAERLAATEPRLVLRRGRFSEAADEVLFAADVPVAPAQLVTVQAVDDLAVARESEVEAAIDDWRERAAERERAERAETIDRLISEHRSDRGGT